MADYGQIVKGLRLTYETGRTKDIHFRLGQLRNLARMYQENGPDLISALKKDLRKPDFESHMYEILLLSRDVKNTISNLQSWAKPKHLPRNLISLSDKIYYDHQPHGVVLIIGPWNYPLHLTLMPLAAALAAGNCILVKPSEISSACSALLGALIPKYLDQECYKVVQGDVLETQKIMQEKFDFIFFTGSSQVGRIIYMQAASMGIPVCLELGGKSPVYIDSTANIRMAVERIIWAKCVCFGQTCVAPDYVLCAKDVEQQFINEAKAVIKEFFGENVQNSKDLGRVINARHFSRLRQLLDTTRGQIVVGGKVDEFDLFIEPTIIVEVDEHEPLMTEEIFGPLLPIYRTKNYKDAIDFINERPNPLALYVFSTDAKVIKSFLQKTNSGGVSINDALYHTSIAEVPFGGTNDSGLGQYHGKFSFDTFTRPRAIVHRSFSPLENKLNYQFRYPPYNDLKYKMLNIGLGHYDKFYLRMGFVPYLLCFVLGLLFMYTLQIFEAQSNTPEAKS
ncbi:aldehyde dehydrogenase family 3 member B1 [Folsomia candida]|uniref:aldehyde dehydrogenase family 3 member B1 n=1 Tax=Folsomia candida TaxID=158441 RepID=UPI000B8FC614|nr:aldehyde dehydrogenase family 3 member B1 [Folsomia candida]